VRATGLGLTGTDAGNYTVNDTATDTADITPASLTVSATGINKLFDNTPLASVTLSDDRFGNDSLTTSYASALFNDKMPGANKPVSVTGIDVTGTDAGNYTLMNTTAGTTASILAETPLHVPPMPPSATNPSYIPPSDLYATSGGIKVPEAATQIEQKIIEKGRATLDVQFDTMKAVVKPFYYKDIEAVADVMKKYPDLKIVVEGHTDNRNRHGDEYNLNLSKKRAEAIKAVMVNKFNIASDRITPKGFGSSKPIADNSTEEGRQKNRRVEAAVEYAIEK